MKVALVHDYIKEYGGAERVLEALHKIYPQAPVFTTVYLPKFLGPHRERFSNWDIRTSFLQWIPFKEKLISVFRIIAPLIFKGWNFSNYDVVIVSATGAYSPNLIKKKSALQICYCHTPPRYLYGYPTAREWKKFWVVRVIGELVNHFLRLVDFKSAQNVDFFIANSKNVAGRIKKFYRRYPVVIYPPVEVRGPVASFPPASARRLRAVGSPSSRATPRFNENFVPPRAKDSYFLAGGRLARPKRIDLALAACAKLKLPLKIFGKQFAGYGDELKSKVKSKNSKIEFLGEVTDEEKWGLMKNARAFIFPTQEEDFGITPVEAMSVGTPVIALKSGGVVESVVDPSTIRRTHGGERSRTTSSGQAATGLFFEEPTVDSLVSALRQFDKLKFDSQAISQHAQKFSKERFKEEIKNLVDSCFFRS